MTYSNAPSPLEPAAPPNIARLHILIGLIQGLLLYFLYYSTNDCSQSSPTWPASTPYIFVPALLIFVITPVLLISSLRNLQHRATIIWVVTVVVVLALLGVYDVWRGAAESCFPNNTVRYPTYALWPCLLVGLFIAHSLVLASASEKKWIAGYSTCHEASWRFFGQLVFSLAFATIPWLILLLGSRLFSFIELNFLKDLLDEDWFSVPFVCVAFSLAMHSAYSLSAITHLYRSFFLLTSWSWILLIFTSIIVVFLLCLPWTGLTPLWATKMATSVLLGSIIILVALINVVAVRDGAPNHEIPRWIRLCSYIAALALLPLAAIAIYALHLRVRDHGWTTDRIFAAAALAIAACYAIGYAYALCRRDRPILRITQVNIVMTFVIIGVLLALLSPILDPARISVNDQLARLADGRTKADKFDYDYLKFEGGRFGLAALNELKARSQGPDAETIRKKAQIALEKKSRWESPKMLPADVVANIRVQHSNRPFPESLIKKTLASNQYRWWLSDCLTKPNATCNAYWIDMDSEKGDELVVVPGDDRKGPSVFKENKDGDWDFIAAIFDECKPFPRQILQPGQFHTIPAASPLKDLEIEGVRHKPLIARYSSLCKSQADKK